MKYDLLSIDLRTEQDVVTTRQRAREVAALAGFKPQDQTSIATAVSELSRHAHRIGTDVVAAFELRAGAEPALVVSVSDRSTALSAADVAGDAMVGVTAARRLADEFETRSMDEGGTVVTMAKRLPRGAAPVTDELARSIVGQLGRNTPRDPIVEVQQQNRELVVAFDELQKRQSEVERLNAELAETNRGVLALYAELDEKADSLRRASELKSRFLSDVTHELRTPLNAMISLSQLLLDRVDGELNTEQSHQVSLIFRSATSLNEMVSDLLDIARIEAGKEDVRVSNFNVADVLAALRGLFRPLTPARVRLSIDDGSDLPPIESDERKLTQILRNLLSNAIKFTVAGEVALHVSLVDDDRVRITVSDTGIGIAAADLERIFADFAQVDSPLQRSLRGTGLGLPLTRKLARLLGGDVAVHSDPGVGSTFTLTFPRRLGAEQSAASSELASGTRDIAPALAAAGIEGASRG